MRDEEVAILFGVAGCVGIVLVLMLVLFIFYFLTLMRALQACSPRNRTMEPGLVWLNLVPVFSLFWQFWTVINVGNSLKLEFDDRGLGDRDNSYGKVLGVLFYSLGLVSTCVSWTGQIVVLTTREQELSLLFSGGSLLFAIPYLILWVIYWVKIAGYTKQLNSAPAAAYDDDLDPPLRRGKRNDEDDITQEGRSEEDDLDDDYRPRH